MMDLAALAPDWFWPWLQQWDTIVSGLGSLALTGGLVYLYKRQQALLVRELDREVRESHTETLRKRIRAWHGDIDEIGVSKDEMFSDNTNLPEVEAASVEPAPALMSFKGEEDDFRAVPEAIEDDRYLRDLLENHAPELQALKEGIEQEYESFEYARELFVEDFPGGKTIEEDDYRIQPTDYFSEWVFEQAVIVHRDYRKDDKERRKKIAESRLRGSNYTDVEQDIRRFSPADLEAGTSSYELEVSDDLLELGDDEKEEILEQVVEIHHTAIDEIESDCVYEHAVDAGDILDSMADSVQELRGKLVEYEGHPLYTGDCPYLDEVSVGGSGIFSRLKSWI